MEGIKKLKVEGMSCGSCAALVEREFSAVPGTESVEVDLGTGTATVAWRAGSEPDDEAYYSRVGRYGYGAPARRSSSPGRTALSWAASAAIAAAAFAVLKRIGGLFPSDAGSLGIGASAGSALLAGAAASVSSCLALVGSLVLAVGSYGGGADRSGTKRGSALARNLAFQAGRVGGFALLGGMLGAAGGALSFDARAGAVVAASAGVLAVLLGAGLLLPSGPSASLKAPAFLRRKLDSLASSANPAVLAGMGAATFFLPCGFALSAMALAVGSGGFAPGAAVMAAFALGTAPVLLGTGLAGSWAGRRSRTLGRAAGLLVVAFGASSAASAASTLFPREGPVALRTAVPEAAPREAAADAAGAAAPRRVEMRVLASSFEPSTLRVRAGEEVEWVIVGENPSGCTNRIVVPGTDVSIPVRKGASQVVRFAATETGEIGFSCWMGMVRGRIVVE